MITFLSFGNGVYSQSIKRIEFEANRSNWFDNIVIYNESRLQQTEFWKNHGKFCLENPRGFGYWIWKPWLISKTLEDLSDDDILVYADAGCTLNRTCPKNCLDSILEKLNECSLGIYCHQIHGCFENQYTKPETLVALNVQDSPEMKTEQIMATIIYIKKCDASVEFVNKWFEYCIKDNYRLVDDSHDINYTIQNEFIDHRHDQSIFSLLIKKSPQKAYIIPDNTWQTSPNIWPSNTLIWVTRRRL